MCVCDQTWGLHLPPAGAGLKYPCIANVFVGSVATQLLWCGKYLEAGIFRCCIP